MATLAALRITHRLDFPSERSLRTARSIEHVHGSPFKRNARPCVISITYIDILNFLLTLMYHQVPYWPYLTTQFSIVFDVYLEIMHCVDERCRKALKHNTEHWRLLNSCPACFYRLAGEPQLRFDWLVSIDGNNSLKRWDKSHYGIVPLEDSRHARSDLWLSEHDVDHFQYEVKSNTVRIVLLFRPCCNM